METGIVFVDYEGVLVDLSHLNNLDVTGFLLNQLESVNHRYSLHRAYLLADPQRVRQLEALEAAGYTCFPSLVDSPAAMNWQAQQAVAFALQEAPHIDNFIFYGGSLDYVSILSELTAAGKHTVVRTIMPLKYPIPPLLAEYERIKVIPSDGEKLWSRQNMLNAVILTAENLRFRGTNLISANDLCGDLGLGELSTHRDYALEWAIVAIREEILHSEIHDDNLMLRINNLHPRVQTCRQQFYRTMALVDTMVEEKGWVAFSALERALKSGIHNMNRRQRQEWIELLILVGSLLASELERDDFSQPTTIVMLNDSCIAFKEYEEMVDFKLVQLAIVVDNFLLRNHYQWMAVSSLLKRLTALTTRLEARAALTFAEEQGIVQISSIPSLQNASRHVTALMVNRNHPFVQQAIQMRDQMITVIDLNTSDKYAGNTPEVIISTLIQEFQMSPVLAATWVDLMKEEKLLYPVEMLTADTRLQSYVVTPDDIIVKAALT